MKDKSLYVLVAAGIVVLLVNGVFFLTYPINIGQSDNPTYLRMIVLGTSNLMHASGYPAVLYFLTHRVLPPFSAPISAPNDINNYWFRALQGAQVLLHLTLFSLSLFLCAKVFGNTVATVLALGWGCNLLFVSNVNATAPEWLQGHAVLLSLLLHCYARNLTTRIKVIVYPLAAGVFGLAYLIKPNSLLFAIALLPCFLFSKERWRIKVLAVSASVAVFLLLTAVFASSYHYPSTGTKQLNFDHAWVLTAALPADYVYSSPEDLGVASLRWAALSRVTPPEYSRAGWVENIEYGPAPDVRNHYKRKLDYILNLSRDELVQFVKTHPLPPGYSQWASAVPLYYYYGLEVTDALGTEVYIESLQSHSAYHMRRLGNALASFLAGSVGAQATFPTFTSSLGYTFLPPDFHESPLGESRIVPQPNVDPYTLLYYNPRQTVSFYGVKIVEVLDAVTSSPVIYMMLNIVACFGLFRLKSVLDKVAAIGLLTSVVAFVSASGILVGLRQKELIAMSPVYFLLLSIGLVSAWRYAGSREPVWQATFQR